MKRLHHTLRAACAEDNDCHACLQQHSAAILHSSVTTGSRFWRLWKPTRRCGWGVVMPARLVRQRRAAFLGGGWLDEPVSEHVSEVSQLGCDVSICSVSIRSGSGVGVWDPPGACMQRGLMQRVPCQTCINTKKESSSLRLWICVDLCYRSLVR